MNQVLHWGYISIGNKKTKLKSEEIEGKGLTILQFPTSQVIKSISCGLKHSAFLTDTGLVYTMGEGKFGALGYVSESRKTQF